MSAPTPGERVEALSRAATLAAGRLDREVVLQATATVAKIEGRLRHGTHHTVVALAGPTGSGKSSLFNALAGADLSAVGVRRPTTGATHACVWGRGGGELLDWLGVDRRHHLHPPADELDGLVLLDLPDFDSTAAAHRVEVDRLVELVDLLVWVADPQKYADEALHAGYLAPLAAHGDVMRFVLNKTDTLGTEPVDDVTADLRRRLADDGIADATVLPVSVATGAGVDDVTMLLATEVARREAAVARIDADLRAAAGRMSAAGSGDGVTRDARSTLVDRLGHASGVDDAADIAAAQHRRDSARATGWPPGRWLRRWGREPVADLRPAGAGGVGSAEIASALRDVGERAGAGLAAPWPAVLRRTALARQDDVTRALTGATSSVVRDERSTPRWWAPVAALQRTLALAAAAGLVWLLATAALGGLLRFDVDPLLVDTPGADWIPLPSALLIGGVGLGLLVAALARVPAAVAGRRRGRKVRRRLLRVVADVADQEVVAHLDRVLADQVEIERLLAVAAGGS